MIIYLVLALVNIGYPQAIIWIFYPDYLLAWAVAPFYTSLAWFFTNWVHIALWGMLLLLWPITFFAELGFFNYFYYLWAQIALYGGVYSCYWALLILFGLGAILDTHADSDAAQLAWIFFGSYAVLAGVTSFLQKWYLLDLERFLRDNKTIDEEDYEEVVAVATVEETADGETPQPAATPKPKNDFEGEFIMIALDFIDF